MNSIPEPPFFWGVTTSGYQIEGGYNGPGQPQNNWTWVEHSGRAARTGSGSDFWNRYEEDLDRCVEMGLGAFRLSLEWARIQPSHSAEDRRAPAFDPSAWDHYARILAACRKRHLEPIVTLHHFTHPAWLGLDAWLDNDTPEAFSHFAVETIREINRRLVDQHGCAPIRYLITINEPNILVLNSYIGRQFPVGSNRGRHPGFAAYDRLLTAHIRSRVRLRRLYQHENWPEPEITLNTFCSEIYWSEKFILDLLTMKDRGVRPEHLASHFQDRARAMAAQLKAAQLPVERGLGSFLGGLVQKAADWIGRKEFGPERFPLTLAELAGHGWENPLDFLAIDYYDPFAAHMFRPPNFRDLEFQAHSLHAWVMEGLTSKWWDWRCLPEGLHWFCRHYWEEYRKPILIAENGMALHRKHDNAIGHVRTDNLRRSDFLTAHVAQVEKLRCEGVGMLGYLHWSLIDNYEWGSFTPRFGLYTVDYTQGAKRLDMDQLGDCPAQTYARLIAAKSGGERY